MSSEFNAKNGLRIQSSNPVTGITNTQIINDDLSLVTEGQIYRELLGKTNNSDFVIYTGNTAAGNTLNFVNTSGDTMTGNLILPSLSATTISATTFYGDGSHLSGIITNHNSLTGLQGGQSNQYYHLTQNEYSQVSGNTLNTIYASISGETFTGGITTPSISATTYYNLPIDVRVTGGTYSNGITTFTNNTGGTFNVNGFTTPFTGGTVSGSTTFTNGLTANTLSVNGINITGDTYVTGGTYGNGVLTLNEQNKNIQITGLTNLVSSVDIYIDGNRVDSYIPTGTIDKPFKKISDTIPYVTQATTLHIASGNYTETSLITFPNYPLIIYGYNSNVVWSGGLIIPNNYITIYNLFSEGYVEFTNNSTGQIIYSNGALIGDVLANGITLFDNVIINSGTITAGNNSTLTLSLCIGSSVLNAFGRLNLIGNSLSSNTTNSIVTVYAGGVLSCVNNIISNGGSGNGISCSLASVAYILSNRVTTNGGSPVDSDDTTVIWANNNCSGGVNIGNGLIAPNSDVIGQSIMKLGGDQTGDMYYLNSGGTLTRLGIGGSNQVIIGGVIPSFSNVPTTPHVDSSAIHSDVHNEINSLPERTVLQLKDKFLIENSDSNTYNKNETSYGDLISNLTGTAFVTIYDPLGSADSALSSGKTYTNTSISALTSVYDPLGSAASALSSGKTYTDTSISTEVGNRNSAISAAISALTSVYDPLGSAASALSSGKTYSDISISGLSSVYQPILVSGTNIKTLNGASLLGTGNIVIAGGQNYYNYPFTNTTAFTVTHGWGVIPNIQFLDVSGFWGLNPKSVSADTNSVIVTFDTPKSGSMQLTVGGIGNAVLTTGLQVGATSQVQIFTNGVQLSNISANKVLFSDSSKNIVTSGIGISSQFIKADGSLDNNTYLTSGTGLVNPMTGIGDIIVGSTGGTPSRLSGNSSNTASVLTSTGVSGATNKPVWTPTTGTGDIVLSNSPILVTPNIGTATGNTLMLTSQLISNVSTGTAPFTVISTTPVNNLSIGGTASTVVGLSVSTGKTLNVNNNITISGVDNSTLNISSGGTLGSNAFTSTNYTPLSLISNTLTFTGFDIPENVIVTFNQLSGTITLTGLNWHLYYQGQIVTSITSGWTSTSLNTGLTQNQYLICTNDSGATTWSPTFPTMEGNAFIAFAIWNSSISNYIGERECHGAKMDSRTHLDLHNNIGTYSINGTGIATGYTLNSTTLSDRRVSITSTTLMDEDLQTILPSLPSGSYTQFFLSGSGVDVTVVGSLDIVPLSVNQPYYNYFNGSTWTQQLMTSGMCQAIFVLTYPASNDSTSQVYAYQFVQGQTQDTLPNIQALTPNGLVLTGFVSAYPEYVFISKIIIQYNGSNWVLIQVDDLGGSRESQTMQFLSDVFHDNTLVNNGIQSSKLGVNPALSLNTSLTTPNIYGSNIAGGTLNISSTSNNSKSNVAGIIIPDGISSYNTTTGSLVVSGGTAISENLNIGGDVKIGGNLTVNGSSVNILPNIVNIGFYGSPSDTTANGGGLTLYGLTNKTLLWQSGNTSWNSSENFNLVSGKVYKINGNTVLTNNTLGSGITNSSLQTLGPITVGSWSATPISDTYISSSSNWNIAYNNRISSFTTTGSSGSSTFISNVLNIPTYTLNGLGGIGLTALSASSPLNYNNGTGAFTINQSTSGTSGYLSSVDWNTFNNKQVSLTFSSGLTNNANVITVNTTQNIITLSNLTNNGFIKTSGGTGTLYIDNATYLTSTNASAGTYNNLTINSTGLVVSGSNIPYITGYTYITGGTYSNGTETFTNNTGGTFNVTGFTTPFTGGTISGSIVTPSISATTYYNLPIDVRVTGGTYSNGITTFTNNTGGTFNVSGYYTGYTVPIDVRVTGGTYSNGIATFTDNTGGTFNVTGFNTVTSFTGGTVSGATNFTNGLTANTMSATTIFNNGVNIFNAVANIESTGVFSFSGLTKTSSSTFNISPVLGWIVQNVNGYANSPLVTYVNYSGATGLTDPYINTSDATYVFVDSASTTNYLNVAGTPQQRRQMIYLGKIAHPDRTNILTVDNIVDYNTSPMSALRDMFTPIKLINNGITISPNGANLNFNLNGGFLYGLGIGWINNQLNPNQIAITGSTASSFLYRTQTGGTTGYVTSIDSNSYDVNGTVTAIPTGGDGTAQHSTNQRVYIYPTGVINIQYGQQVYNTLSLALAGIQSENFIKSSNVSNSGILIGVISIRRTTTNLSDSTYAVFIPVSMFGETVGGTNGISTTTLQQAYNNSVSPEIITNSSLGALSIENGTGNADNITHLFEGVNASGSTTSFIAADGSISANTMSATTFYGDGSHLSGIITNHNSLTGLQGGQSNQYYHLTQNEYSQISGNTLNNTYANISGETFTGGITTPSISATTYYNLPIDVRVTGGTYSNGIATFTNNTGGTFNVNGLTTPFTGGTVSGATTFTNGLTANTMSATTYYGNGSNLTNIIASWNGLEVITVGENAVAGALLYLNTDGKYYNASNTSASTSSTELRIAMSGMSANTSGSGLLQGIYTTTGLTSGAYWIGATSGTYTTAQPSANNAVIRYIGTAINSTQLEFNPDQTYIEITSSSNTNVSSGNATIRIISTSQSALANDSTIKCISGLTITLPSAIGIDGKVYNIKNSSNGTVIINTSLGQTIDNQSSISTVGNIASNTYPSLTLQSDGQNWILI